MKRLDADFRSLKQPGRCSSGPHLSRLFIRGICRSSASPRPPCDGTPSSSVWPSPRQTPGPSCPYPPDRTPSSHRPDRCHARHARILQIGLHLTQPLRLWMPLGIVRHLGMVQSHFEARTLIKIFNNLIDNLILAADRCTYGDESIMFEGCFSWCASGRFV